MSEEIKVSCGLPESLKGSGAAEIQGAIDVDKYLKSSECGYDLCPSYAPFCAYCDKSAPYPCAEAYLKSLRPSSADGRIRIAVLRRKTN